MPRKAIALNKDYPVGDGQVRLTVMVGDRQFGSSMVFLDDELVANGDIDEFPLGKGAELAGKTATVYTVVTDIRDKKNDMSVSWIIKGGRRTLNVEKSGSATKGFGSQMFRAEFRFTGGE